jgi:hypothetical protein
MNTKKIIQEEVIRIQEIMGLSSSLLNEQVNLVPKPLIKNMLKLSDDAVDVITKFFNLTDNQIDNVVRQIDDVGVDKLSDEVLEVLSKYSKDNVDDLVRVLKSKKLLGSNFDEIASRIFQRVDDIDVITMEQRDKVIKLYSDKLDRLSFLDGADEIKQKLVRDFQTEFDAKFSKRMVREAGKSIDSILDNILRTDPLDNIPEGAISDKLRETVSRNMDEYKQFIEVAKKKRSLYKEITKEEYDRILNDAFSTVKTRTSNKSEVQFKEMMNILKKDDTWWSKRPTWAKILFVVTGLGFGDTVLTFILWSLKTKYSKFKNPLELWDWFNKISGVDDGIYKLTESNVEGWFKLTYPAKYVDQTNFKNNFNITLNTTQSEAVIEANYSSEEWGVKIQDNKIVEK